MKKRYIALIVAAVALLSFTVGAVSKGLVEQIEAELRGDFTVYIDGEKTVFRDVNGNKVEPILYNGTTYLPVRAIGELMGKTVYWYQDEKRIELVTPSEEDSLVTDADVIIDGKDKAKEEKVKEEKVKEEKVKEAAAEITLDEAKEIALDKANVKKADVTFTKAKLEYDDKRAVYDIDFKTDTTNYDAEIDAVTGKVTEWETEARPNSEKKADKTAAEAKITLEKAKKLALDKAGFKESEVIFEEAKLDYDDGRLVYEIEFRKDRVEYSAEIDAEDGKIVSWDIDND